MTDDLVSDHQLELTGDAVSRVLQTLGPDVFEAGEPSAWDTVFTAIMQQRSTGILSPARAAEELNAVRSVAAAGPDLKSRLDGFFFSRPLVRRVLASAVSETGPDLPARLARIETREVASAAGAAPASRAAPLNGKLVHEPISEEDLATLVQHLAGGFDPLDAIFYPELEHLGSIAAAIIVEASWATGVRPVEWVGSNLAVEIDGQLQDVHRVYKAALQRDPPPNERSNRPGFLAHARHQLAGLLESGPVWLEVNSAKSVWLQRHGLSTHRSIGLARASTDVKMSVFCATAVVRRIGQASWSAWQRRINRRLRQAGRRLLPARQQPLKLYSFRHDFIDRCKAVLSPAETAALAGHSSARTKMHYGRPRRKGSTGAVVPAQAAPAETAAMEMHLERQAKGKPDRTPARTRRPTFSDGPSPSPSPGGPM